jgi:excisionase family DNA binding protein
MEEIFALIKAFNRLEERVVALTTKVDILVKSPFRKAVVDEPTACKVLGISERTLITLRTEGKIPFIKIRRRVLYRTPDLYKFLKENTQKSDQ